MLGNIFRERKHCMTSRMKRCIRPAILVAAGILVLLFMIPDYISFVSIRHSWMSITETHTGVSAYRLISDIGSGNGLSVLIGILMILAILVAIILLAWGVLCLLREFNIVNVPEMLHLNADSEKYIYMIALFSNMVIHVLAAFLAIIYSIDISSKISGTNCLPDAGMYLLFFLSVGAFVGYFLMEKNGILTDGSSTTYECSNCRAKAKAGSKFCAVCGSPVVAIEKGSTAACVCSSCGARMKSNDRFCTVCGAVSTSQASVCSTCGAKIAPGARSCTVCGTPVVPPASRKEAPTPEPQQTNQP